MASDKTLISKMRVKELRQELESRGLETTGIGPVLKARLGEAMKAERSLGPTKPLAAPAVEGSQGIPTWPQQHAAAIAGSGNAGTNLAGEGHDPAARPLRPARDAAALETRSGAGLPRKMSTSTRSPPPARTETAAAATASPRTDSSVYVMQFDGGSRGNPGPSGAGAVLYRVGEDGMREEVWIGSLWVGQYHTNNEAEYSGLIEGLAAAKELGVKNLTVEGDSKLVIMQMLGNYKVSSEKMLPLFKKAKGISKNFDKLDMEHIERALNGRADSLANLAMDTQTSARVTHPSFAESTMR